MSRFWADVLTAWLHYPPDHPLAVEGSEARGLRYARAALAGLNVEATPMPHADRVAAALEPLPVPPLDDDDRSVKSGSSLIHPLSAVDGPVQGEDESVDEGFVVRHIEKIVASLKADDDSQTYRRFLALWRLLPERLAAERPTFGMLPADVRVPDHTIWQQMDVTAALAAADYGGDAAFLSFSLGPVQSFISAARSLRDLWTGSMILSWLTFQAMLPVIERFGPTALVYPSLRGLPFLDSWLRNTQGVDVPTLDSEAGARKSPCLPNRFVALVPYGPDGAITTELADACLKAARAQWREMNEAVRRNIDDKLRRLCSDWDRRWSQQVDDYFEMRTAVVPWRECGPERLAGLLRNAKSFDQAFPKIAAVRALADAPSNLRVAESTAAIGQWQARMELSARLMEAVRGVRHSPPSTVVASPDERVPPKCSLLGSLEQMGPADLAASRDFWQRAAAPNLVGGVALRANERFSAVALVKRFAGPAFLKQRLGLDRSEMRWQDTATVAAAAWLDHYDIDPEVIRRNDRAWSGQWLHWPKPRPKPSTDGDNDEAPCADEVWKTIQAAKAKSAPPAYYAVLMIDGDDLGGWLRGERTPKVSETFDPTVRASLERQASGDHSPAAMIRHALDQPRHVGPMLHAAISEALANFALHVVPKIVEEHKGELIYAGGDDVLALLPTSTALTCALRLRQAYRQEWDKKGDHRLLLMGSRATLSAGLAVVHYKEDLRFALVQARTAEQAAKRAGKDALQVAICRRSGEHSTALCPWDFASTFEKWIEAFLPKGAEQGASDRWLYHLRRDLPVLATLPLGAMAAELARQIGRAESPTRQRLTDQSDARLAGGEIQDRFNCYREAQKPAVDGQPRAERFASDSAAFAQFITLGQSASFMARGRDE